MQKKQEEQEEEQLVEFKPGLWMPKSKINKIGNPKMDVKFYQLREDLCLQAEQTIEKDQALPPEELEKAVQNAANSWDRFYRHHTTQFFKNRTYLDREIPELQEKRGVFVELGCGVGNTIFPLREQNPQWKYYGCDFARSAINLIKSKVAKEGVANVGVEVVDLVKDQLPEWQRGDVVTLIFVLSAIAPQFHAEVIAKVARWMKPGSVLYFRDYGRYDFGQLNLTRKGNKKLTRDFYVKSDGVCVYYFDQDRLSSMMREAGLQQLGLQHQCKLLSNRKTGLEMYRVWLHGRFRKPLGQSPKDFLEPLKTQT